MAKNNALPSPASRRNQDPSNRAIWPPMTFTAIVDTDQALLTLSARCVIQKLPLCVLAGASHADPLMPIAATLEGANQVRLTFAEVVEVGDTITFGDQDPGIRGSSGQYVYPARVFVGSGAAATSPTATGGTWTAATLTYRMTFNQNILPNGGSIAGIVYYRDANDVLWKSVSCTFGANFLDIVMAGSIDEVTCDDDKSFSSGIGTVVLGQDGGLAATDWTDFTTTFIPTTGAPLLAYAYCTGSPDFVLANFNCTISIPTPGNNKVTATTDTTSYTNNGSTTASGPALFANVWNTGGPAAAQWTFALAAGYVKNTASAATNAAILPTAFAQHP